MSCMSWLWLMLPRRLCRPPSPVHTRTEPAKFNFEMFSAAYFRFLHRKTNQRMWDLLPPRADRSCPPLPPLPRVPGMGGLLRYSFTLRQFSSSLSVFGSWDQKKHNRGKGFHVYTRAGQMALNNITTFLGYIAKYDISKILPDPSLHINLCKQDKPMRLFSD